MELALVHGLSREDMQSCVHLAWCRSSAAEGRTGSHRGNMQPDGDAPILWLQAPGLTIDTANLVLIELHPGVTLLPPTRCG